MQIEIMPKMHLAFLYELNDGGQKRAYERLDQFLEEKGLNPSKVKHYFYYLNMSKKDKRNIIFVLYALVSDAINASGEISTMMIHGGPYLVFDLTKDELYHFSQGEEDGFENKVKAGLNMYKKTRIMDQLFALIEEVVEDNEVNYRCHIPVK